MSKFQVVNMKLLEGNAKASGKPYKMLIASGMFTGDDGTMEVGEVNFMEAPGRPLPMHLKPGGTYTPTIGANVRDGKLTFVITELKEIAAVGKSLQAAA